MLDKYPIFNLPKTFVLYIYIGLKITLFFQSDQPLVIKQVLSKWAQVKQIQNNQIEWLKNMVSLIPP